MEPWLTLAALAGAAGASFSLALPLLGLVLRGVFFLVGVRAGSRLPRRHQLPLANSLAGGSASAAAGPPR